MLYWHQYADGVLGGVVGGGDGSGRPAAAAGGVVLGAGAVTPKPLPPPNPATVVTTVHNLDCQGECSQDEFAATGVHGSAFAAVGKALDERTIGHNPERLCLLKGGAVYSNAVVTVSPTYAQEAAEGGAAGWLRATLLRPDVRRKFRGILNGVDVATWNPAADPALPAPYSADAPAGKALCKRYVQLGLGLDVDPDAPLVVCITRLVPQKVGPKRWVLSKGRGRRRVAWREAGRVEGG